MSTALKTAEDISVETPEMAEAAADQALVDAINTASPDDAPKDDAPNAVVSEAPAGEAAIESALEVVVENADIEEVSSSLAVSKQAKKLPLPEMLQHAVKVSGRSLQQIVTELARLTFGPGRLSVEEYFQLELYNDAGLENVDKKSFVGMTAARAHKDAANFRHDWFGIASDKLAFNTLMRGYGFRVAETAGYFHAKHRLPGLNVTHDADALANFLRSSDAYPMFGKPTDSQQSIGSASLERYDAEQDAVIELSGKVLPVASFAAVVAENYGSGYIFQKRLTPHSDVAALCGNSLATVRVFTINGRNGFEVIRTSWKIPAGSNGADNFWRKGNILAALDIETGRITRAVEQVQPVLREIETHPDTGARLIDAVVPDWKALLQLALDAHGVFDKINLIGWDIASTDDGPLLIEANHGPDFMLAQIAQRRGFMDERFTDFLAYCKEKARDRQLRIKGLLKTERRQEMRRVF